jgi:hypothetical protein
MQAILGSTSGVHRKLFRRDFACGMNANKAGGCNNVQVLYQVELLLELLRA